MGTANRPRQESLWELRDGVQRLCLEAAVVVLGESPQAQGGGRGIAKHCKGQFLLWFCLFTPQEDGSVPWKEQVRRAIKAIFFF
jgi:hypothetical protein